MAAALELEDYSYGSDTSEAEQVYYLADQDIEDDLPEDYEVEYEEEYEPSTPSLSSEEPEEYSPEAEELQERLRCRDYEETIMKVVRQEKKPQDSDDRIIPLIMFDGGSFKHIWGRGMQDSGLLFNHQELSAPVKVALLVDASPSLTRQT